MKRQISILAFFPAVLFAAGLLLFSGSSCQSHHLTEDLLRMDTLQNMMNDVDGALLIDEDAISARYDSMDVKLKTILAVMPDSGKSEIKNAIVRYSAIRTNYAEVLKDYPVITFDVDKEKEDVKVLKQALLNNELTEDVFMERFGQEKSDLLKLQERIKKINYNTFAVEQDYKRNSATLNPLYEKLKARTAK